MAGGVVGAAQQQEAGTRFALEKPRQVVQVQAPAVGLVAQRALQAAATQARRHVVEVRVDGRRGDDPLAGLGERGHDGPDALQHVRRRDHEVGIGTPAVANLAPVGEGGAEFVRPAAVANVRKVGQAAEGVAHHRGRPQVVLGDPGRENAGPIESPLQVAAGPFGHLVDAVRHQAAHGARSAAARLTAPHARHCGTCGPQPDHPSPDSGQARRYALASVADRS